MPDAPIGILPDPPFGAYTRVRDVNEQGVAVGVICLSIECNPGDQRALLWIEGSVYDLNTLIPPGSGWTLFTAEAINDAGEIVCVGAVDGLVSPRGFRLTPKATTAVPAAGASGVRLALAPNPTFGAGEISWESARPGAATLDLYDVTGRWVAGRHFVHLPAGISRAAWSSLAGASGIARGMYVLRLERAGGAIDKARVMVMR